MNANEVIANRALEIPGQAVGTCDLIHPNNHINRSQSTNDSYPTALRLAILLSHGDLSAVLAELAYELKQKAVEFGEVIEMGRTQLQDAVPYIGYENATRIAQKALASDKSVMELVLAEGLVEKAQLVDILSPQKMTRQGG
jgi:aspartate ammonia-lyase